MRIKIQRYFYGSKGSAISIEYFGLYFSIFDNYSKSIETSHSLFLYKHAPKYPKLTPGNRFFKCFFQLQKKNIYIHNVDTEV